jgi:hypothetical protein
VVLVNDAGIARLYVIDNGVFDLRSLEFTSPETFARMRKQMCRLRELAQQIAAQPQIVQNAALLQQSPASAD